MKYPLLFFILMLSLFVTAQKKDTSWKKKEEKEMIVFHVRPKPPAPVRNPFFPSAGQGLSLNEIFNQYRLTPKVSKNDPKNLQMLLTYPIEKCCVGYAINNMVRDFDNDWEDGIFRIRNLYIKQPVVFEKITVRAPNGTLYFIRKICTTKTG